MTTTMTIRRVRRDVRRPSSPLAFDADLVRKYDQSGPRYTSYPTADRFHDGVRPGRLRERADHAREPRAREPAVAVRARAVLQHALLLLRCNKVITKDHGRSAKYIRYVAREIGIVSSIARGRARRSCSCTWAAARRRSSRATRWRTLMGHLRERFPFAPDAEVSIEVDPRKVDADDDRVPRPARLQPHLGRRAGLRPRRAEGGQPHPERGRDARRDRRRARERLRLGQHRPDLRAAEADACRASRRRSTASSTLSPDRIALYSYAHVPHLFKPQRRIDVEPTCRRPRTKLAILALAIEKLGAAGYVYIGMDHFAKPDDELARAQADAQAAPQLPGLHDAARTATCSRSASRRSARSAAPTLQNVKHARRVLRRASTRARCRCSRGYQLTDDDLVRRDVIARLMCDFELAIPDVRGAARRRVRPSASRRARWRSRRSPLTGWSRSRPTRSA